MNTLAATLIGMEVRKRIGGRQSVAKRIHVVERLARESFVTAIGAGETAQTAVGRAVAVIWRETGHG